MTERAKTKHCPLVSPSHFFPGILRGFLHDFIDGGTNLSSGWHRTVTLLT